MDYKVVFTPRAEKYLDKIERESKIRILEVIVALSDKPRPRGCVKLKGFDRLYRIRVGDYRVIYEVDDGVRGIIIAIITRRGKGTYKNL